MFCDEIIIDRIHKERDAFIDSIKDYQVCALATAYHNGDKCEFFQDPKKGSFNVCFFVQFFQPPVVHEEPRARTDGDRWVVRVPLQPCLAMDAWEKIETQMATMQYVASQTTIPVPKIHSYSTAREKGPHGVASFMILEYVDGKTLREAGMTVEGMASPSPSRDKIFTRAADVYTQLRRLGFPAIGRLVPGGTGEQPRVLRVPFSLEMNLQHMEIGGVTDEIVKCGVGMGLTSAKKYYSLLLDLAFDLLRRSRAICCPREADARRELYFLHQFADHVHEKWSSKDLDRGPFVLAHNDLDYSNMLFDDELNLLAVIDWEWAQTVGPNSAPAALSPPVSAFGINLTPGLLPYLHDQYSDSLLKFCSILESVENAKFGQPSLSRYWADSCKHGGVVVGKALASTVDIDSAMRGYLDEKIHGDILTRQDRIQQFIDGDQSRRDLVARKAATWASYKAEAESLGISP